VYNRDEEGGRTRAEMGPTTCVGILGLASIGLLFLFHSILLSYVIQWRNIYISH